MKDWGFIFDYSRCVGCHACIVACYNQNHTEPPMAWRMVVNGNPIKIPLKNFINLSIACNHCIDAPCMINCPAIAYSRDHETGAIIHSPFKCIGCKYCTWACPYEAPKFNPDKGVVEKCNFCNDLLKKGNIPACAAACPTGALTFGELKVDAKLSKPGFPEVATSPRINVTNESIKDTLPEMATEASGYQQSKFERVYKPRIHPLKEIPLFVFTSLSAVLVGWFITFYRLDKISFFSKIFFIFLVAFAGFASLFHLGKPLRAFRALLHVKSSWLSREIALFGLFTFSSLLYLFTEKTALFWFSVFAGTVFLISVEMVYHLVRKNYSTPIHSANTLLTAATLFSLLTFSKAFVLFATIKLLLYLVRHAYNQNFNPKKVIFSFIRFLGIVIPFVASLLGLTTENIAPFLMLFIIGELIDRFEYYASIDTYNPYQNI